MISKRSVIKFKLKFSTQFINSNISATIKKHDDALKTIEQFHPLSPSLRYSFWNQIEDLV